MYETGGLLRDRLYQKALIEPFLSGADKLLVVSGYATPAMVSWHFTELARLAHGKRLDIELIVGMTPQDGLPLESHTGFRSLTESTPAHGRFKCSYVYGSKSVHSKAYVWVKDDVPAASFMGSANYTQTGFGVFGGDKRAELLQPGISAELFDYFNEVEASTIGCDHGEVDQEITFYRQFTTERNIYTPEDGPRFELSGDQLSPLAVQRLSLLTGRGDMGTRSGLNHGQREGRDPNQAYIPVPTDVQGNGFFPPVGGQFTVRTDDGKTMIMACGGTGGKNLMTAQKNALLGEYFRFRMGLPSGAYVHKEDLTGYRSTADVVFRKIDDETYLMDFSPN